MKEKKITIGQILILQIAIFFYSLSGVFNKMAALESFMSFEFILYFGISLAILGIYAIVWQMILKHVSLSTAYSNRPVSMIWGIIMGSLIFHEQITLPMIIGSAIIMVGVYTVVTSNGRVLVLCHHGGWHLNCHFLPIDLEKSSNASL